MGVSEDKFLEELRKVFAIEAKEHLQAIIVGLINIEKTKDPIEYRNIIETIYREAHSLKGASRSVNMSAIGSICQSLEDIFSAMKNEVLTLRPDDFDTIHHVLDEISHMLASTPDEGETADKLISLLDNIVKNGKNYAEPHNSPKQELSFAVNDSVTFEPYVAPSPSSDLDKNITAIPKNTDTELQDGIEKSNLDKDVAVISANTEPQHKIQENNLDEDVNTTPAKDTLDTLEMGETIRVEAAKLDSVLLKAEELISIKLAGKQRISEIEDILHLFQPLKKEWERAALKAHKLSKQNNELEVSLDWSYSQLLDFETRLKDLRKVLQFDLRANGMMVDSLLEDTKTVLMLPFSTLLKTLPKMVRDISREQNKKVDLVLHGDEIKVDKRILERIKDPLVHIVRNCIDHGLETTDLRLANNKPPIGTITITIIQIEGTKIQVQISDDGNGIDLVRVRKSAVKCGLLSEKNAQILDEQSALQLIFQSGVSSNDIITDISGRGLGMAIVKEAVDKLNGSISIETHKGKGTTFKIYLPVTLATFRGILVQEYGQTFALPTSSVERVIRIKKSNVKNIENHESISIEGIPLSLVRLGTVLGLKPITDELEERDLMTVAILKSGQNRMAFAIDKLLNEQEILIKNLGKLLVRVRNIAGATVLGSGQVILILNVVDLLCSAARTTETTSAIPLMVKSSAKRKTVLVVEDSVTSRTLFKNILTTAGYDVHTAVDGMEAWIALREKPFDLIVSDVEMPRMDGFELTAKIRNEAKFADLPVILVTSLISKEDRERGIDVGADAYIVKSSFDQSNLLEVIQRLIG